MSSVPVGIVDVPSVDRERWATLRVVLGSPSGIVGGALFVFFCFLAVAGTGISLAPSGGAPWTTSGRSRYAASALATSAQGLPIAGLFADLARISRWLWSTSGRTDCPLSAERCGG